MRTQAKPFIVQVKKRKRTGSDDSRPVRSLIGPVAKELAEELAGTSSGFRRGGDGNPALGGPARTGAQTAGASSAWPVPAGASAAPPGPAVIREEIVTAPAPIPRSIAPVAESAGEAQQRVHRQRFKWSAWRSRRGKTTATSPAQPPRGQRWKRRLPRAAR